MLAVATAGAGARSGTAAEDAEAALEPAKPVATIPRAAMASLQRRSSPPVRAGVAVAAGLVSSVVFMVVSLRLGSRVGGTRSTQHPIGPPLRCVRHAQCVLADTQRRPATESHPVASK